MTLGSLFDGAGTCPLAGVITGFIPVWASEIEPFPVSVTKKRFPAAGYAILLSSESILAQNIICGDSLKIMKGWEEDEKSCCCSNI